MGSEISLAGELRELGALHQAGTLTGEEFALAKRALIAAASSAQGPTQATGPDRTESASAATERLSAPRESAWRPQPPPSPSPTDSPPRKGGSARTELGSGPGRNLRRALSHADSEQNSTKQHLHERDTGESTAPPWWWPADIDPSRAGPPRAEAWEERFSKQYNRAYWVNHNTQRSSWLNPQPEPGDPPPATPQQTPVQDTPTSTSTTSLVIPSGPFTAPPDISTEERQREIQAAESPFKMMSAALRKRPAQEPEPEPELEPEPEPELEPPEPGPGPGPESRLANPRAAPGTGLRRREKSARVPAAPSAAAPQPRAPRRGFQRKC